MIKKIFKFELLLLGKLLIEMPKESTVLKVGIQNGMPYLWALVNPESENEKEFREFETFQTGQEIFTDATIQREYIDSLLLDKGNYVIHVFERLKNKPKQDQ